MLTLLKDVAAAVVTPRFRALARAEVMEKRPGDLVTIADHEAEALITDALLAEYPDALVVGEEAAATDRSLVSRLADAEHAFTVDPVDGTKNFVHGSPNHALMVSELRAAVPVRAWIWQPEHGRSYVAERGAGVRRDDQPLTRPVRNADLDELRVLTSWPGWEGRHGQVRLGASAWCCGVDYPWLAEGTVDGIVYSRCLPWDHAPGWLFVAETGGVVRHLDGAPFDPSRPTSRRILAAGSPDTWTRLARELTGLSR